MIETERLVLRHWLVEDAPALYKYASDNRVSELALWPTHTSVEMSRDVIKEVFLPNPYCFAIILKESNESIGCIGLVPPGDEHHEIVDSEREIGYWIGHPFWNMGMTTEALQALIVYCPKTMGLTSLLVTTDANNIASQKVAEKCGFRFMDNYLYDGVKSSAYRLKL